MKKIKGKNKKKIDDKNTLNKDHIFLNPEVGTDSKIATRHIKKDLVIFEKLLM